MIAAQWSGPIPAPGSLREFDDIIKDGAERIMRMAEQEQQHRFAMDKANVAGQTRQQELIAYRARGEIMHIRIGQLFGAGLALICIFGAISIAKDAPWVAAALVGIPMASVIKAFMRK